MKQILAENKKPQSNYACLVLTCGLCGADGPYRSCMVINLHCFQLDPRRHNTIARRVPRYIERFIAKPSRYFFSCWKLEKSNIGLTLPCKFIYPARTINRTFTLDVMYEWPWQNMVIQGRIKFQRMFQIFFLSKGKQYSGKENIEQRFQIELGNQINIVIDVFILNYKSQAIHLLNTEMVLNCCVMLSSWILWLKLMCVY